MTTPMTLADVDLIVGKARANATIPDLRDADLRDADLRGVNLRGGDLRYANLRYADLRNANLRYADVWDADFQYANLSGTSGASGVAISVTGRQNADATGHSTNNKRKENGRQGKLRYQAT